jgi:hypothetical protein
MSPQEDQVPDELIDYDTAVKLAQNWIAQEVDFGTIPLPEEVYEEDGVLYFFAGSGGTTQSHILMNGPKVFVNQTTGEVGFYRPDPEEEETTNG